MVAQMFNAVFGKVGRIASSEVVVQLFKSKAPFTHRALPRVAVEALPRGNARQGAATRGCRALPRGNARQRASNYMQMICRYMSTKWRRL